MHIARGSLDVTFRLFGPKKIREAYTACASSSPILTSFAGLHMLSTFSQIKPLFERSFVLRFCFSPPSHLPANVPHPDVEVMMYDDHKVLRVWRLARPYCSLVHRGPSSAEPVVD
jgi:hypothetical protein